MLSRMARANLAIAVISFGAVTAASYLQSAWSLQPCTMCIIQRYAFLVIGVLALVRGAVGGRSDLFFRFFGALLAFVGALASAKVEYALLVPSDICGRDKIAAFLNHLPWVEHWPALFKATGICGDNVPPVLGLPFHIWSLALFAVLSLLWTSSLVVGGIHESDVPRYGDLRMPKN
ncbi:TPA: disulfide bond formation protein B [Burkholderia vietnamiensis]|nr:disulfide bond formation protein B [Burkholderia vietnamiensis]